MKVLVGLSGGVDSSAAAALLKEKYDTSGVTLSLYTKNTLCLEQTKQNICDASTICKKLGIPHTVLSLEDEFKEKVIDSFVSSYKTGLTPNPCILCNKFIKFGIMNEYSQQNGFDKIATGHYARIEKSGEKYYLKRAVDTKKDQTYVLYTLNQHILSRLLLPLGDYTKEQCREIAEKSGLITAHKSDSQDICFVPNGDYGGFIEELTGAYPKGCYVDKKGNILGEHNGIIHYTVGQRKGLGIALGKPAFVISKNAENNTVLLGKNEELFTKRVSVSDINFITDALNDGENIEVKLRYTQKMSPAVFHITENGALLEFTEPQRAAAPGQSAVFYKENYCLGGGIING